VSVLVQKTVGLFSVSGSCSFSDPQNFQRYLAGNVGPQKLFASPKGLAGVLVLSGLLNIF